MNIVNEFRINIEQRQDFEFVARFDKDQFPPLAMDEPPPLGQDHGPNAARVLAAAIGNCLSASLLFCARKARVTTGPITAAIAVKIGRTESGGRLRIAGVEVEIDPHLAPEDREKAGRCLDRRVPKQSTKHRRVRPVPNGERCPAVLPVCAW